MCTSAADYQHRSIRSYMILIVREYNGVVVLITAGR